MKNVLLKAAALACAPMFFLSAAPGAAQTYPTDPGDFWDVTGIEMLDGGDLQYLQWIASEWKKEQEFAKSKGWIKSYHVLSNLYPRQGEADLYLVIIYGDSPMPRPCSISARPIWTGSRNRSTSSTRKTAIVLLSARWWAASSCRNNS